MIKIGATSKQLILTLVLVAVSLLAFNTGVLAQTKQEKTPNNQTQELTNKIVVNGTVESLEGQMTAWMYGTHLLVNTSGNERYALKGDEVDLNDYSEQKVTVNGVLVHERVDSGPPLIEVEQVTLKDTVVEERLGRDRESLLTAGSFLAVSVAGAMLLLKLTGE